MKNWSAKGQIDPENADRGALVDALLAIRSITTPEEKEAFFHPKHPLHLTPEDVGIDPVALGEISGRINRAIAEKESMVVYADYDADGITAGAALWEALHRLGAVVMPYIPHRKDEGYGFSEKGLKSVKESYNPSLVISVDHGVTAKDMVPLAASLGMEIIITDHHVKPEESPQCPMLHTTTLSGSGVSWFLAAHLLRMAKMEDSAIDLLPFATIGTITDLVPLTGPNRSIVSYGLEEIRRTSRVGIRALMEEAGIDRNSIAPYHISHMIGPRLNAMGRLTHAMDALRLLCTTDPARAQSLAAVLGSTNRERQTLTMDMLLHAKSLLSERTTAVSDHPILILSHDSYDQGIIGLVAGKLTEEHYRPTIVMAVGETVAKGSARSIPGFNIVEAIRSCSDLLIDVGGHPAAAGFTIRTDRIEAFSERMETIARTTLTDALLTRTRWVDLEIPITLVNRELYDTLQPFAPFGMGNAQPVFASAHVTVRDARIIGKDAKHLKLKCVSGNTTLDCVAFNQASAIGLCTGGNPVDLVYTVDLNVWNGNESLQLSVKSIT